MAKEDLVALKFTGTGAYDGYDPGQNNRPVRVQSGGVVMVSDQKATQLKEHFPDQWTEASAAEAKKAEKEADRAPAPAAAVGAAPAPGAGAPAGAPAAAPAATEPARPRRKSMGRTRR